MEYALVGVGLVLLLLAGDALVRGAVNLALRLGIPAILVGLTIVAFGTSAPELVVSVGAVLTGAPGLALGNVVGSNTANILLVLGLPALFYGIGTGAHDTRKSYLQMLGITVLFLVVAFLGPITWAHGLVLLAALGLVLADQARDALVARREKPTAQDATALEGADTSMPVWKILGFLTVGLVGLPFAADLLVDNAVIIATRMGVSETVIGLTLVAVGTSLPEMATTLVAAFRRQADVALGNVIGSNLFNLAGIIGIAAMFGAIPVDPVFLRFDLWVMLGASLVLAPFVLGRRDLSRLVGAVFTAAYALYILVILF